MKKSIGTAAFFGAIFFVATAEAAVWQNVDFGMSRSEIETLHPKKRALLIIKMEASKFQML